MMAMMVAVLVGLLVAQVHLQLVHELMMMMIGGICTHEEQTTL